MKDIKRTLGKVGRPFVLIAILQASAFAQDGSASAVVEANAPTENLVVSFDGSEADGMGWYRDAADWKDLGFSFRAPDDGQFQKVSLRLQAIRDDYQQESKFRLEIYETATMDENPLDGKKIYSGSGHLAVRRDDAGLFLTFDLGRQVPLVAGNSYSVLLIWEEPASVIVFQANLGYTEGLPWFRSEATDGKFVSASDSSKPSLTYFIH